LHTLEENESNRLKKSKERRAFPEGKDPKKRPYDDLQWSRFNAPWIARGDSNEIIIRKNGHEESQQHPTRQASGSRACTAIMAFAGRKSALRLRDDRLEMTWLETIETHEKCCGWLSDFRRVQRTAST
jgi:hypothetical protein